MAQPKTRPNDQSVEGFLNSVENEKKRQDCFAVLKLMEEVTGEEPQMWGDSIVGFGRYSQRYANGRELDWPLTGFSPRKQSLTLYISSSFTQYSSLLDKLGKHTTGKVCLYIKKIEDIDLATLKELVRLSVEHVASTHA